MIHVAVFILLPSALGGIKSSWRGNRIETGKNLNPVQKIWGGEVGTLGGGFPPKDAWNKHCSCCLLYAIKLMNSLRLIGSSGSLVLTIVVDLLAERLIFSSN
jgi:hypothetical protein